MMKTLGSRWNKRSWFIGIQNGLVISFAGLTGLGVLEFISGVLARFNTTAIMMSLAWQPTVQMTGWLIWCWLVLIIAAYWLANRISLKRKMTLIVIGLTLPLLAWLAQALYMYGMARTLSSQEISNGIKQSVWNEDVGRYIFFQYAKTLSHNGADRNKALSNLAEILIFSNYNEEALDALLQVNKNDSYDRSYWLSYSGAIVATHNWTYLNGALNKWQDTIVAHDDWEQIGECWNTAKLFSPVYGQLSNQIQMNLLETIPQKQRPIVNDILQEPSISNVGAFIQSTTQLQKQERVKVLWACSVLEVTKNNWERSFMLGRTALSLDPHNSRLAVDVAHAAFGAHQYSASLTLLDKYLGNHSARGAYIKSVATLAMGQYSKSVDYATQAEQISKEKQYMELALTAHSMKEVAEHELEKSK